MTKLSKDEMQLFTNSDINVYIGFSDLSEDEYEEEKKRIHQLKLRPTSPNNKLPIEDMISQDENNILCDSNKENTNIHLSKKCKSLRKQDNLKIKKENNTSTENININNKEINNSNENIETPNDNGTYFTLSNGTKVNINRNLMLEIVMYEQFPEINYTTTSNESFIISNFISNAKISKTLFTLKSLIEILQYQTHFTSISQDNITLTNNIQIKKTNKSYINELITISLTNYPSLYISLQQLIPSQYLPKSQNDILKYSPIDISGINIPRLIICPYNTNINNCFNDCNETQFKRIIINFGPGELIHFILKKETINHLHLNLNTILTKSEEELITLLNTQHIEYIYCIQKKGDIVIIEPGVVHIPITGQSNYKNTIIVHWCQIINKLNDIEIALQYQQRYPLFNVIPLYISFTKMINNEILLNSEIDINMIKTLHKELTPYLNEYNDIKKHLDFMITNKISKYKQPLNSNINFCDYCNKEIYNYYNISTISDVNDENVSLQVHQCLNCYIQNYEYLLGTTKNILIYKFTEGEINLLFERMNLVISNKKNNLVSIPQIQQCFENIQGDIFNNDLLMSIEKVNMYLYENVYIDDYGDVDMVSRFLVPSQNNYDEDKNALIINGINNKYISHYTEFENVFGCNRRFSPINCNSRKINNENEFEMNDESCDKYKKGNKNLFENLLKYNLKQRNEVGNEVLKENNIKNNRGNINDNGNINLLCKGKSFFEMIKQSKKLFGNGANENNYNKRIHENIVKKIYEFDDL